MTNATRASGSAALRLSALGDLRSGISLLEAHSLRLHLSYTWGLLATALAFAGEYADALTAAERALARAAERDQLGEVDGLRVTALVAGVRDMQLARAEALIADAMRIAKEKGSEREQAMCEWSSGQILRANGARDRAADVLQSAVARAARIGMRLPEDLAGEGAPIEREV
jgi:hypothetical protein